MKEVETFKKLISAWRNPSYHVDFFSGRVMLYTFMDDQGWNPENVYRITQSYLANHDNEDVYKMLVRTITTEATV